MKRHALSALVVMTIGAALVFAQTQLFGPTAPNNTFFGALDNGGLVRPLIGVDSSGAVEIDPDAIGTSFGGAVTVDGTLTQTGTPTFATGIALEGATADASETTLTVTDPTADRTVTLPDSTFTVGDFAVKMQALLLADHIDQIFFIADRSYTVTDIDAVWATAETAAGDIMIERLQGTEACGSGDDLLTAAIDGTATANTVVNGTLTATTANLTLAAGDQLCFDATAGVGEILGTVVTVGLVPAG